MSNVETRPAELTCRSAPDPGAALEILDPRDVPLGGPRAMTVRRTLPQRARSLIGAPHTGLQTVSWLFAGEIEHRDSLGTHAMIRAGELNLMTGGHGICHSEVSTAGSTVLHGVQLWVALPDAHRDAPRDFQHHVPVPVALDGGSVRVFLGTLQGDTSPVRTFTPLLGAELTIAAGARLTVDVDPLFEHGLLVDIGPVMVADTGLARGSLGFVGVGARSLTLTNPGAGPARVILLGGEPFGEDLVMWWNFVGRSHEEIVGFREEWQGESERFGRVEGYPGRRLPAPPLPNGRLRPRQSPSSR